MVMQTWPSDEVLNLISGSEEVLNDMYERGKTFGTPFREAFLTMPKGTYVWHNRLSYWPTKPWDSLNGLITLAGKFGERIFRIKLTIICRRCRSSNDVP